MGGLHDVKTRSINLDNSCISPAPHRHLAFPFSFSRCLWEPSGSLHVCLRHAFCTMTIARHEEHSDQSVEDDTKY